MIKMDMKKFFFDRPGVARRIDKARRKRLGRGGGIVRKISRNSMRRLKKPSLPGQPPRVVHGQIKAFTFYAYDQDSDGVVIGPQRLPKGTGGTKAQTVPEAMEYGAKVRVQEVQSQRSGKWRRIVTKQDRQLREHRNTRTRTTKIAPRPFMGPALKKGSDKYPKIFEGMI